MPWDRLLPGIEVILYTDLATALPRAEVRRLDDAGHSGIAWLRPDAVVQAIRDTLSH